MAKIIVSACLLGCPCRYDGAQKINERICALAKDNVLIPVCPEQMGGLSTPRDPAERSEGRVVSRTGRDVSAQYRAGAEMTLYIARLNNADFAILKAKSPACGSGSIYDGTHSGKLVPGSGVAAELLKEEGFRVYTEDELDEIPELM